MPEPFFTTTSPAGLAPRPIRLSVKTILLRDAVIYGVFNGASRARAAQSAFVKNLANRLRHRLDLGKAIDRR